MTDSTRAVFLSYASQDAEPARRICEALRAAGIEVWFDQDELRGGDVWDQHIHQRIHDCALFMPLISAHTEARTEGYFRLEWKLAVDRSHLMADDAAFLLPVVIDGTSETTARVPDKFHTVQWTRLPDGETPAVFCREVSAFLAGTARPARRQVSPAVLQGRRSRHRLLLVSVGALLLAAIGLFAWRATIRAPGVTPAPQAVPTSPANAIPEHSIAVLPFANLNGHKDEEYFSDGLAEDLLNLLSKVPGLQVAARTSAFSFKGHAVDVPTMGRQLRVASVLEGTVRKVGNHLRVTAQLERTADGYQIWSETYDRELDDVFRMQDEIANAVVKSLKVSLLWGAPRNPGPQNSEAYLVFLQGRAKMATQRLVDTKAAAIDFEHALKLDPNYAPAYVELATAELTLAEFEITANRPAAFAAAVEEARLLIEQALALDPSNAQAYVERGYLRTFSNLKGAEEDYRRGIQLNPNSARGYEGLAAVVYEDPRGFDEALTLLTRARQLDPLEPKYDVLRATALFYARGNTLAADALLTELVAHHPLYRPALERLSHVKQTEGHLAEAVMYGERALKLDPLSDPTRRLLVNSYLHAGDAGAARLVANEAPHALPIQQLGLLVHDGDWRRAAEVSYAALADDTWVGVDRGAIVEALRLDFRATRDFRARPALERLCGVTWDSKGVPTVPTQQNVVIACVALGDILIASGERARGERLLRASLAAMNYAEQALHRGDLWNTDARAFALALLGDRKATLVALGRSVAAGVAVGWGSWSSGMWMDPAFNLVREDPEFQALILQMKAELAHEQRLLDRLRAEGRVPDRSGPAAAPQRPRRQMQPAQDQAKVPT